jgi:23S rRNA (guanosine2251-2'-O)-methyltransferase
MREIVIIAHNIRSCHNIGSLFRTAEGLGIRRIWLTGYSPYPKTPNDNRLPYICSKLTRQINKTALGAHEMLDWQQSDDINKAITALKKSGYKVIALEQSTTALNLPDYQPPNKVAILLGNEVHGIEKSLLNKCDQIVQIPMSGQKESFNVVEAATMAMYHCRFGK